MKVDIYSYVKVWVRDTVETDSDDIQESVNKVLDDDVEFLDTEVIWDGFEGPMDPKENNDNSTFIIKAGDDKIIYKN